MPLSCAWYENINSYTHSGNLCLENKFLNHAVSLRRPFLICSCKLSSTYKKGYTHYNFLMYLCMPVYANIKYLNGLYFPIELGPASPPCNPLLASSLMWILAYFSFVLI